MAFLPHIRHLRRRLYERARHARHLLPFLVAEAARLTASPASTTVTPTHVAAAAATGVLTVGANAGNGKVVTIGGKTYTFKTNLTEVKASGNLVTDNTNAADGSSCVIGSKTYLFQTTLTNVDGHIHIGADADTTLLNLARAINASGGTPGTDYATANTVHPTVTSSASVTAHTITLTAKTPGVAGNAIVTTATSSAPDSHIDPAAATLLLGVDPIVNEIKIGGSASVSIDNLIAAIIADTGAGSLYATGTVASTEVTAAVGAGDTMGVTAIATGVNGNYIYTTTDLATSSFADTHLLGGVAESFGPTFAATAHGRLTGDGPVSVFSSNGVTHVPAGLTSGHSYWVIKNDADTLSLAVSRDEAGRGHAVPFTGVGTGTITIKRTSTNEGIYDALRRNRSEAILTATDVDNFR